MKDAKATSGQSKDIPFLDHRSNPLDHLASFDSKRIAALSVTVMIKVIAQMRNPRRGHDAQGRLKRVNLDKFNEGYANFMAPMRMDKIACLAKTDERYRAIYDGDVLKPATDTFLTPEWDEMVPFPNSKLHFELA